MGYQANSSNAKPLAPTCAESSEFGVKCSLSNKDTRRLEDDAVHLGLAPLKDAWAVSALHVK